MSPIIRRALGIAFALACLVSIAAAQEIRGTIFGRVIDQSGLSVPGARVQIVHRATNVATSVTTNIEGNYVAPFMAPGEYSLTVQKDGFSRVVRDSVFLQTQERLGIDFTLKPGTLAESVTVSAESPMIQTASADIGRSAGPAKLIDATKRPDRPDRIRS
jgi:hypothetical protein